MKALVTGGATRIGRGICLALANAGARVAVHYRDSKAEAEATADECNGVALHADLRDVGAVRSLVRETVKQLGGLDIVVNNAAVYDRTPFDDVDEAIWDRHLETNLKAPFFVAQEAARAMETGVIVNLTDWGVAKPHPHFLPYYAAKAGLAAMTVGLARTLAPDIRVNAVAPGPILVESSIEDTVLSRTPLKRMGSIDSVVQTVMFLIGNDYITGETITVDGGRSRT